MPTSVAGGRCSLSGGCERACRTWKDGRWAGSGRGRKVEQCARRMQPPIRATQGVVWSGRTRANGQERTLGLDLVRWGDLLLLWWWRRPADVALCLHRGISQPDPVRGASVWSGGINCSRTWSSQPRSQRAHPSGPPGRLVGPEGCARIGRFGLSERVLQSSRPGLAPRPGQAWR